MKRLALLGSGAVAQAVAPALRAAGYTLGCWARTSPERVADPIELAAAGEFDAAWVLVSDRAVIEVAQSLPAPPPIVLHASGFLGTDELPNAGGRLHPLVSMPGGQPASFEGAAFSVSGDPAAVEFARGLAEDLGGFVLDLPQDAAARQAYHASAALTANGLVALMDLALGTLSPHVGREAARRALASLARGVLDNVEAADTQAALTGPVARGDDQVVAGHLEALPADAQGVYRLLARRMLELSDLGPEEKRRIESRL